MDCFTSSLTPAISTDLSLTDTHRTNLNLSVTDFATTAVVQHLLVSKSEHPNAFGACLPVITQLNIPAWEFYLQSYHDAHVVDFLCFGCPASYMAEMLPTSSSSNHPSAVSFADHYINTELGYHAIAGPFSINPLHQPLVCSPLQTVPKRGSNQRRVMMDLSYPPRSSVNSGIAASSYLNEPYKLRLLSIARCQFILQHGRGCLLYNLRRAYDELIDKSLLIQKIIICWVLRLTVVCISILIACLAYEPAL